MDLSPSLLCRTISLIRANPFGNASKSFEFFRRGGVESKALTLLGFDTQKHFEKCEAKSFVRSQ